MTDQLSNFAARLRECIAQRNRSPIEAETGADNEWGFASLFSFQRAADGGRPHLDNDFNAVALELFALQFAHNAAYRKLCEARNTSPQNIAHWTQIPVVPTAAFKEFDLTCLAPAERTHIFHSSGTTAQHPSRHFHCAKSLAVYESSLWPSFAAHVLGDSRLPIAASQATRSNRRQESAIVYPRLAILTPPPVVAPRSSLVHMFETVRQKLNAPDLAFVGAATRDGSWSLDFNAAVRALRAARETQTALILLGTAFSFVQLLDFLAENELRFELPPGSRVMETGGYKGRSRELPKAELHALITHWLGVPPSHIVCEYGMSELSSQAYDGGVSNSELRIPSAQRTFRFPPWARAQIVSPETGREVAEGQTGLIRVFDLANVFSVMAIQTEDLGVRRGGGFELLGRAALAEPRGCSLMAV